MRAVGSGNIFFSTQAALDIKILEILRVADEIQTHSIPTIQHCYPRLLTENSDPEDCKHTDDADQIRKLLIHENYFSQKDIEFCAAFDIGEFKVSPNFPAIESLHQTLRATCAEPAAVGAG